MSHQDIEWLRSAYESFGEALLHRDVGLAKDIIADTFDAGFPIEARAMSNELRRISSFWEPVPA